MADPTPTPPTPQPAAGPFSAAARWLENLPYWGHLVIWLAIVLAFALAQRYLGVNLGPPPPMPVAQVAPERAANVAAAPDLPEGYATGWVPDHDAMAVDARATQFRTFAATPAGQVAASELPKSVFGWKYVEKLTGKPTPLRDQNPEGSCVGFGNTAAVERTEAAEILARGGDPSEFAFFSPEVTYAGSKVEGARAMGASVSRSDGSAGVFVRAFFQAGYGMCPQAKYASCDLTEYSAERARSWRTSGPPAEVLAECKKHPVKDSVKVTNWEQAKQAMASGYFVGLCGNWKASAERDANGVARDLTSWDARANWNHCVCVDGYYTDPATGQEYGHVENSWSNLPDRSGRRTGQAYHTGPVGWGEPTTAGFWWPAKSIDRVLRQGDSYGHSGIVGFPARHKQLDWLIRSPQPRRDPAAIFARPEFALAF